VVNHNLAVIDLFRLRPGDRVLQFSTINFDAAVEQIFPTWLCGATLVLPPDELPGDARDMLRLATAEQLTVLNLPTTYWHDLAYAVAQDGLALPACVRLVIVGGEKASTERLALWETAVGGATGVGDQVIWHNTYGPTETTIISTLYEHVGDLNGRDVPIGRPIANTQLYVLDAHRQPVPIGVPRRTLHRGAGVARGYLNRPDLTAEKFISIDDLRFTIYDFDPSNRQSSIANRKLYRTGDLVRYRADGQLEFIGRADDQVKVRGFRVELGEIEAVLNQHPALREGVVLALDGARGDKQLVAYVAPANAAAPTTSEMRRFLAEKLPEYMLPALFISVEAIPRTPSGKLNRRALPAPDSARPELEAAYVAPRTPQEEIMANVWAQLLNVDQVGVYDNFFELGGHSLLATQLTSRLRDAFGVDLPLREIFEAPTVAALALKVELAQRQAAGLTAPPITPVVRDGDPVTGSSPAMPLSFAQQRLWFLDQLEPDSPVYNIPDAVRLRGELHAAALEASLNEIVRRHESLRTTFTMVDGRPVQIIHPELRLSLPVVDLTDLPAVEREARAQALAHGEGQRPFNLERGPLVRAQLLKLADDDHVVLFTMHHIVSDGWSSSVLVREVAALYPALAAGQPSPLPPLTIQYADFAHWQRNWLQGEALAQQLDYWRAQLADAPPRLDLPIDHPRPSLQSNRGAYYTFELPADLLHKLETLSQQAGATLFMTLLAAFQTLLSRVTRQDDISIGAPIANRTRAEIEPLIGFFVNTLVLRTRFAPDAAFRDLLAQVRETTLGAYAHQDVPFEMIVDAVQPERDLSHTPLFQVMFMLHSQTPRQQTLQLPGLRLEQMETTTGVAMFDMTLALQPGPDGIAGGVEYNADLFEEATIARLMRHFRTLLEGLTADPDAPVATVPLLETHDLRQILVDWNDTAVPYPHDQTLHQLFEAQAARTPDATAVIQNGQQLTYAGLNARANQLAHYLQAAGIAPGALVGLSVARSLEMAVALLGILKAGGAYVPLDPDYPDERLTYMITDSGANLIVTDDATRLATLDTSQAAIVDLVIDWPKITTSPLAYSPPATRNPQPDDLAYVIYTSGSTGKPKGVAVTHRNVINHNWAMLKLFELTPADRVLQFATINFDAAVEEIFPTWFAGATLALRGGERLTTTDELMDMIVRERLTVVDLPTAYWHQWVYDLAQSGAALPDSLRLVIVGGEKAAADRLKLWRDIAGERVQWLNTYGPTETTIVSTAYRPDGDAPLPDEVPIGRPIANTQAYLLDEHLQPVPVGVPGELIIGGDGVARGYLNRPDLTAEKFISIDDLRLTIDDWMPSNRKSSIVNRKLYRTGDLARWLPNGDILFLGRADTQVKIRGFRVEMGEIEAALKALPAVQDCVVTARDMEGVQRLVAYLIPSGDAAPSTSELRQSLSETLPDYMIPSYFVPLPAFPITPSGKVNRRALPAPDSARPELAAAYAAPRTPAEEKLAAVWADVLGLDQVGIHDNFFELGGDSILSIQVIARAKQAGLHLTPRQLFEAPTVAGLAAVAGTGPRILAEQGVVSGTAPLTPIQHWFFEQAFAEPQHWNQALLFRLRQPLNKTLLEATVAQLLRHHDALRLRFTRTEESWIQTHAPAEGDVPLTWVDLSDVAASAQAERIETLAAKYQASLDLSQGPLMRVVYFNCRNQADRLLIVIHHLAVDGVSWRILLEDLPRIYQQLAQGGQAQLPPKSTAFKQWAERLEAYAQSEAAQAELAHWTGSAAGAALALPRDFTAGANSEASARSFHVSLTAAETTALLRDVPPVYRTEINDVLLTALAQAITRWTGHSSALIELESFGREDLFEDVDISRTVGWFTAVYPLHLDLSHAADHPGEALKTVKEQLRRVPRRGVGYGVLRYLSKDPAIRQQMAALPQAEISFNYLGQFDQRQDNQPAESPFAPATEGRGPDHSLQGRRTHLLEIDGGINNGRLGLEWTYSANQYRDATIERVANMFIDSLRAIINHCQNPEAGGVTPSDFPLAHLDQKQLDKVLAKMQGKRGRRK
jgi:amino acid adenylation domain-containing protein/non-ribosomal peptide synthase protein (TIGR01720 family)